MAAKIPARSQEKGWLYHPSFPRQWKYTTLYSLAEWVNGLPFRDIQFASIGKPVIKIAEIKQGISEQTKFTNQSFNSSVFITKGDLLFSWSGQPETSIDAFWWRGPDGWLNQHIYKVTPKADVDRTFFYYLLRYLKPNFVGIARNKQTTGLGHVTKSDLENIITACPELPEQRAIAYILGALDDKIELNRRMNETLEAMAQALFKSWFVDFDPVRAKAGGRWKRGQSLPGLPAQFFDLFSDHFKGSKLGEIPKRWDVKTVGDLAEVSSGSRPNVRYADALPEAYVPLWGGNGPMAFVPEPLIDYPILLTGRVGTLGSVFRITTPCWPSDNTLILRARQLKAFEYLFLQLKRVDFASLNRGSTQPLLTQTDLRSQFVVLPSTAVLERFHAFVKELYGRIDASESESSTLAALRDKLLPKLISGELRVKGA